MLGDGVGALRFLMLGGHLRAIAGSPDGASAQNPPDYVDGVYAHGFGVGHFGLRVEDVDAAVDALRAAGVRILADPVAPNGIHYAYVAAPDGVIIEFTVPAPVRNRQ